MKKRTSPIWKLPDEEFINLVKNSTRMRDVLNFFGLENKGGNFKTVKQRIKDLNLNTSHWMGRIESSNKTRRMTIEKFKEEWLVNNSEKNRCHLKEYLIKFNLIPYECEKCKNQGTWQESKLSLQLEHKNGNGKDNRLENLCFLCPNCHSQTDTFAGKKQKITKNCIDCGKQVFRKSTRCKSYSNKNLSEGKSKKTKITWPSTEDLQKLLWEEPTSTIAKNLGVSDKAVEKFCKKHKLTKPSRGYWSGRSDQV